MFINLLFITIFGLFWGGMIFTAYRMGLADGREFGEKDRGKKKGENHIKSFTEDGTPGQDCRKEETVAESRLNHILNNINTYNGTGLGQKDV